MLKYISCKLVVDTVLVESLVGKKSESDQKSDMSLILLAFFRSRLDPTFDPAFAFSPSSRRGVALFAALALSWPRVQTKKSHPES